MRRIAFLVLLISAGLGSPALAADRILDLDVPVQGRQDALLTLARQAGVSLGFAPGAHCAGQAGVVGRLAIGAALQRLLAGSTCEAVRPDPRTVVIRPRPARGVLARLRPPQTPPALIAQSEVGELSELVVTAEKRETLLTATASSLTAVSGEDLARQNVADVGELSLLAAGVIVTNLGPGRDKVLLRGLSDGPLTGHTQSTVATYLGDLRLAYNAPDPDLPLLDVARVEILRGPQGSLYGGGSIGGVLHVVPNAPDVSGLSGSLHVRGGVTQSGAASHSTNAVINAPVLGDRMAVRLVTWRDVSGGYLDDTGRGLRNVDRTLRQGLRLSAQGHPSGDLRLDGALVLQTISTRDAHYAEPAIGARVRSTPVAQPHDNDFLAVSLSAHRTLAWADLTASLGMLDHDVATTYDASRASAALSAAGLGGSLVRPIDLIDENQIRTLTGETRLASIGAGRLQWLVGAFSAMGEQHLDAGLSVEGGAGYHEQRRDRLFESALFGEVSYDLTPDLTVSAGGRAFNSLLRTSSQIALAAPLRRFEGRARDIGFSRKLRIVYRISPGFSLYGVAAEGYRTDGFNTAGPPGQVFADLPETFQPMRRYGGDELWSYEAGVRWRAADGHAAVRLAGFFADWQDIQANLLLPSGLPFTANLGDGRSLGVELEATYAVGPLRLSANGVLQESELTHPDPGLGALEHDTLPGVPAVSFAVAAGYETSLTRDWSLNLDAGYAFVGRSRLAIDATTSARMGGYGGLRLGASAHTETFSVGLTIDNALDSRGDTLAFGNPFSFRARAQSTPQRPRTLSVSLGRRF